MKTTKAEAKEIYDRFHGVLRNLNGGTSKENERSAATCFERLKPWAYKAAEAAKNPGKLLQEDETLLRMLQSLPERYRAFGERYGLTGEAVSKTEMLIENQAHDEGESMKTGLIRQARDAGVIARLSGAACEAMSDPSCVALMRQAQSGGGQAVAMVARCWRDGWHSANKMSRAVAS